MTAVDETVSRFLRAAAAAPQLDGDVDHFRAAMAGHLSNAGPRRPVHSVVDQTVGGLRLRIYRPGPQSGLPVLVYLHGGAFVRGDLRTSDVQCREMAARAPAVVVSVDYRLAPEHPYPAALDDARAALAWVCTEIADHGGDPGNIVVGGESAGANIATVLAAESMGVVRSQVLVGGVYDLTDDLADVDDLGGLVDVAADAGRLAWISGLYAGAADPTDPRLSPLRAAPHAGPPALVVVSGLDPFAVQGRRRAAGLARSGVAVEVVEVPGMPHGFGNLAGLFPEAAHLQYDRVARVLRDGVHPAG